MHILYYFEISFLFKLQVKLPHPRQATTYQYRDIEPVPSTSTCTSVEVASSTELTPRKRKMQKTISKLKRKIIDKNNLKMSVLRIDVKNLK